MWPLEVFTSCSTPVVTAEKHPQKLMKKENELSEQAELICLQEQRQEVWRDVQRAVSKLQPGKTFPKWLNR